MNTHLVLPVGTQVVTKVTARRQDGHVYDVGSLGVIVAAPADATHSYTVRVPDGSIIRLRRRELGIHRQRLDEELSDLGSTLSEYDLNKCVIYRCIIGSRAYGLEGPDSDTDVRGIYLPPASAHWSLFGVPEQLEDDATQECYWELQKFLKMALKANPNVLECLYAPLVEYASPLAKELLVNRHRFVTRHIYQTYNGYVLSQFKRLEQDLRTAGSLNWKHAMHLVRLLLCGVRALQTGSIPVKVAEFRDDLLAIKAGTWTWEQVNDWRVALHKEFEEAYQKTSLPDAPDFAWANEFLLKARRHAANEEQGK